MKDLRRRIWRATATAMVLTAGGAGLTPLHAAASDSVAFVGDSIGRDAEPAIRALVEPEHRFAHYEAVAAGSVPYHYPRLLRAVSARSGPDIVVLELGTGDAFYGAHEARMERNARILLRDLSPHVDCIRWLDIKPGGTLAYPTVNRYAKGVNRAIHRAVAAYPKAEYMHYAAWTDVAGNGYFLGDLLHHNAAGRVEMGRIVNQAVDSCDPDLTTGRFWDVRDDFWAADDIAWMADSGIAAGYANGTYRAVIGGIDPKVSRAQMAGFLWRLAGSPTGYPAHPWRDGPAWIDDALDWLAATGTANGYADRTFRPALALSRAAMAHLLHNYALQPPAAPSTEVQPPVDTETPSSPSTAPPTTAPAADPSQPPPTSTATSIPPPTTPSSTTPSTTTAPPQPSLP